VTTARSGTAGQVPGLRAETAGPVLTVPGAPLAFHVMAKPTGALCNLDCEYCFFLSKEMLYPGSRFRICPGYKAFFHHIAKPMDTMALLLRAGQAPAELMRIYAAQDSRRGRNDPCPCGNGPKWKHCHGTSPAG